MLWPIRESESRALRIIPGDLRCAAVRSSAESRDCRTPVTVCLGSARVPRAGERVLAIADCLLS